MYSAKVKTEVHTVVTLNNNPIDSILQQVCEACHEGIEEISYIRQTIDEGGDEDIPNSIETWRDNAEYLEGILCRILNILGD